MKNPIWIIVDGGTIFEGHQAHWANTFFSNATERNIREYGSKCFDESSKLEIREMTDEEVAKYPEIIKFQEQLLKEYGEV